MRVVVGWLVVLSGAAFGGVPGGFLADPHGVMPKSELREREEFLAYHASDSPIWLRVMLWPGGAESPSGAGREIGKGLPEGKPGLGFIYYWGEPLRAELLEEQGFDSEDGRQRVARLLERASESAAVHAEPSEQFREFCVQVSSRSFELEESLAVAPEEPDRTEVEAAVSPRAEWWERLGIWWPVVASVGGFLLAVALMAAVYGRRSRLFPDIEVPPRFGGAHGAGVGATIRFGDARRSAAVQKKGDHGGLERI